MIVRECKVRTILYKYFFVEGNLNSMIKAEFKHDDKVNGFIAYGYADHEAGFIFEILACASKTEDKITIYEGNEFVTFKEKIARFAENEIIVLKEEEYDLSSFDSKIEKLHSIYNDDKELAEIRMITQLDTMRSLEFPDDIVVLLYKENVKPEKVWIRSEGFSSEYFQGRLLSETVSDYGIKVGDVVNFVVMQDEKGKLHAIGIFE